MRFDPRERFNALDQVDVPDLRAEIEQRSAGVGPPGTLQPAERRPTVARGLLIAAGAAGVVLVLIGAITLLTIASSDEIDPAGAPNVQISGTGIIGPITSGEVVSFTVTAEGGESFARGQIAITTIEPGIFGHWSIDGTVVCILADVPAPGFWEVRYQMTRSSFPEAGESGEVGAYASFYVKDDPGGDSAGELTGTADYESDSCGPRGDTPVFPLNTGSVQVITRQ